MERYTLSMMGSHAQADDRNKVPEFVLALRLSGYDDVRVSLVRDAALLEGTVPTYDAKREVEQRARDLWLDVQNHLRVVPGSASVTGGPVTTIPA